jgi:hypothetical protein
MNEFNVISRRDQEAAEPVSSIDSSSSMRGRAAVGDNSRLTELEIENSRLHRLVAELLIKNQQLRSSD